MTQVFDATVPAENVISQNPVADTNMDATTARHQGQSGSCTHLGNERFVGTESKSRLNFLELLHAGQPAYVVDVEARAYVNM